MEKESRIMKVWGIRDRAYLSDTCEVDILTLLPYSQCSVHYHKEKLNKFIVIEGEVIVRTGFGDVTLKKGARLTVNPPLAHQFRTNKKSAILLEIAYTNKNKIKSNDIMRIKQGGRKIRGKEYTLKQLIEKNLLKFLKS
jgi:mannose-6-phosphate isomerase-like protein (cupin superfamily)